MDNEANKYKKEFIKFEIAVNQTKSNNQIKSKTNEDKRQNDLNQNK